MKNLILIPPILRFHGVRDAILKRWPTLRNCNTKQFLPVFPSYIRIMMFDKKNKFSVYSKFINYLQYKQKYKDKWNTTLNVNLSDQEWKMINILPFRITKDTSLRWLQYRIIHRCIATNDMLSKFNLVESSLCTFCSEHTETIKHLFF